MRKPHIYFSFFVGEIASMITLFPFSFTIRNENMIRAFIAKFSFYILNLCISRINVVYTISIKIFYNRPSSIRCITYVSIAIEIKNLVNIIDVNIDVRIPIANVTANPFIGPEPNE